MRKLRYAVAMSLDGHIAGPNGEYDWIGRDPEVDFAAFWSQFDTLLMGRRTFELAVRTRGEAAFTGVTSIVFSRTLKQQEHPLSRPERRPRRAQARLSWARPCRPGLLSPSISTLLHVTCQNVGPRNTKNIHNNPDDHGTGEVC